MPTPTGGSVPFGPSGVDSAESADGRRVRVNGSVDADGALPGANGSLRDERFDADAAGPDQAIDATATPQVDEDGGIRYASQPKRKAKRRAPEATVITVAEPSYDEQLRSRRKRYLIMMGMRVPFLIAAALLYQTPWIALAVLAISIPLPWVAVLLANDRPARKREAPPAHMTVSHDRALPVGGRQIIEGESVPGRDEPGTGR